MHTKHLIAAALLACGAMTSAHATLVNVTTNGSWNQFDLTPDLALDGGLGWIDINDGSALSFQFTVDAGNEALLTVVDTGASGDRFSVSINGVAQSATSSAVNSFPSTIGQADFDIALGNADYSRGFYVLGAGSYTVTGSLFASAMDGLTELNSTSGGLKVEVTSVSAVPLPAAAWLMLSGLGALGLRLRRREPSL
jgi:hypothetical protein